MVYANADTQKLDILRDNKGKSGIYLRKNGKNGKIYVGSSQDLRSYFNIEHLIKESSMVINRALLKEGYASFSLYILEYCEKKDLLKREQYYLDTLNPQYNLSKTAGAPMTGRSHSEETRGKISSSLKGEKSPMFGRAGEKHPMFGKSSQKIEVIDISHNITTKYDSISAAALALGIKQTRISMYFINNQKKPYKGRYIFKKVLFACCYILLVIL